MLTGMTKYRRSFFGKYILMVEYSYNATYLSGPSFDTRVHTAWRDATLDDLQELFKLDIP